MTAFQRANLNHAIRKTILDVKEINANSSAIKRQIEIHNQQLILNREAILVLKDRLAQLRQHYKVTK